MRPRPLLVTAAALLLAGCGRQDSSSAATTSAPTGVRTSPVEAAPVPLTQTLAATVRPLERATIAARVLGAVTAADFTVGQAVSSGELLLTLAAAELPARLAQARAALAQTEREAAREASLVRQNASAADTALVAEDRRRIAAAAVTEAEALFAYTRVTAPFAGTITQKLVNSGDLATPGTPLLVLEATDHLRAEVQVPETFATPPLGTAIFVQLTPDTAPVFAQLVEFSAAADPATRTRLAKLALPATSGARSGQFVRVLWPADETSALLIPTSALSALGQMERVFVVTPEGRAHLRLVKSAAAPTADGRVAILAGLTAGETVVLAPAATLRDGQPVTVQP
jgi:RND family efflux transporter MFP subunit